jgi:hypothetical protein
VSQSCLGERKDGATRRDGGAKVEGRKSHAELRPALASTVLA